MSSTLIGPLVFAIRRCSPSAFAAGKLNGKIDSTNSAKNSAPCFCSFTFVAGRPGGTGVALDPSRGRGLPRERLFVAGGLRSDTVAGVVRLLRPFAVDVASGVERAPGIKDHEEIENFIRRAKAA